ncbi:mucin-17 [Biomphalaria glabrata]
MEEEPLDQNTCTSPYLDEAVKTVENDKVASILNQVSQLSELDKYMLYLQLPTEETTEDGIDDSNRVHISRPLTVMAKRTETAVKWIRQNYAETSDQSVFLPNKEVYEHYREQCESDSNKALSIPDFGKVMKFKLNVDLLYYPIPMNKIILNSFFTYGYKGLQKRVGDISSTCTTCHRDLTEKPSPDVHLYSLSCQIVCEWASKLLDRQLTDIKSLSEHLVSVGYSYGKAAAKFSLLSGSPGHPKQLEKDRKSPRFQDGQVLLQRKLLQKETIRQHKQKLMEHQRNQRQSSKMSPLTLFQPGVYGRKQRKLQPRPSSVQSYTPSWSSSNASYGNINSGHTLPLTEAQNNVAQGSSRLMDILAPNFKNSQTPTKRCQSASVVEKYSDSLSNNVLELFQEKADMTHAKLLSNAGTAFLSPSTTSDSTDTVMSSPAITRANSHLGNNGLDSLLAQHYKRNGENISPDGDTKRRCMTSLGVREQENLNPIHPSDISEFTKLRPYSCPVICSDQAQTKSDSMEELKVCTKPDKEGKSAQFKCDQKDSKENKQEKKEEGKIHFVQKPTVINGRVNNLHNVVSCPDFQQFTKNADKMSDQGMRYNRPSSNILNSLLSSDFDLTWRTSQVFKADQVIASTAQSLASSSLDLSSLPSNQLRVITDPSMCTESAVTLSNQSSRSAFVPVTSHKQISSAMTTETKMQQHNPSFSVCKTSESLNYASSSTNLPADITCMSSPDSLSRKPSVEKVNLENHPFFLSGACVSQVTSDTKTTLTTTVSPESVTNGWDHLTQSNQTDSTLCLQKQSILVSSLVTPLASFKPAKEAQSQQVMATAASTLAPCTTPVTRISTSTVSSPIISTSSPVSTTQTAFVMTPPPGRVCFSSASFQMDSSSISSYTSPVTSCTASVTTPLVSNQNSSSTTPSRRVTKNRFTPIRPKLGGSGSPQFSTTPPPTKKDMRPVSAILKEQQGYKVAKGLFVNLGSACQGEVKFQMPADLLCLAPGKSKTSDLVLTINAPHNASLTKETLNSSPVLWPLASPVQHSKSNDSLFSPVFSQSDSTYSTGHVSIEATGLMAEPKANTSVLSLTTLCSPSIFHTSITTSTSTSLTANKQFILLSPTKSVNHHDQTRTNEQLHHNMATNGHTADHTIDLTMLLGLDNTPEAKPDVNSRLNSDGDHFLAVSNLNDAQENVSSSSFREHKERKPLTPFGDSADKEQNLKTMSLSSTLLSELSHLVSAGQQPTIQHNSSPSAFYKCTNQQVRGVDAVFTKEFIHNDKSKPFKITENSIHPNATSQTARKRKFGTDEHGCNKKVNRSVEKDLEDDVFIINIGDGMQCDKEHSSDSRTLSSFDDRSADIPGDVGAPNQQLVADTDMLLGMIPNTKYLTVKETVKALNDLRAKINCVTPNIVKMSCPAQVKSDLVTSIPVTETLVATSEKTSSSIAGQPQARDGRNVSLNVESVESDALLDIDPAWNHNFVGEVGHEQKMSVGVAAKSRNNKQSVYRQVPDLVNKLPVSTNSNLIAVNPPSKKLINSCLTKTDNHKIDKCNLSSSLASKIVREKASVNLDMDSRQAIQDIDALVQTKHNQQGQLQNRGSHTFLDQLSDPNHVKQETSLQASNHPTLAQYLTVPAGDKVLTPMRSISLTNVSSKETEISSDHELPGDILDFITESMCHRKQNSDVSFYHDIFGKDKVEPNSTLLRSLSAPNTLALAHQKTHIARVNDIKVSLADSENMFDLDCDTNSVAPQRQSQNHSNGIFLSPVGPAKMNRRLSIERPVSNDTSSTKTQGERPPSRLQGNVETVSNTQIDRLVSKILTDTSEMPNWNRSSQGSAKEDCVELPQGQQVSQEKSKLPERSLNKLLEQNQTFSSDAEARRSDGPLNVFEQTLAYSSVGEARRSDGSINVIPTSDGGHSFVSKTSTSDIGRVSPNAVRMTTANVYGNSNRRVNSSPATIFMPLRGDSSRGVNFSNVVGATTSCYPTTNSSEMTYTKLLHFLDPTKLYEQVKLVSAMQSNKNLSQSGPGCNSAPKVTKNISSTSQELPTQLQCIPTPPSSPSNCHSSESHQSASHVGSDKNNHCGQLSHLMRTTAQDSQSSNAGPNNLGKTAPIPKVPSPKAAPPSSPLPHGNSRSQMYNPHPSPPFTPSSQLCLASPRCPTPGPNTSGCTTPISDSSSVPNRFVPIQTSGILGSSAVGYIQPIRPVVTNVANLQTKSQLTTKSKPLELPNFLNTEAEVMINAPPKKEHQSNERLVPPALVLSLTGGIGSVSGRGMKDGWGGHDMTTSVTTLPSGKLVIKSEQPDTVTSIHLSSDMLPTYEEAMSLLVGTQQATYNNSPDVKKFEEDTGQDRHVNNDQLPKKSQSVNFLQHEATKASFHSSGQKSDSSDKTKHLETLMHLVSKSDKQSFPQQSLPMLSQSVVTLHKPLTDSSLRQLLSAKPSSLSSMLQAPAFSLDYNKFISKVTQAKMQTTTDKNLRKEMDWKCSKKSSELWASKWAPPISDSFQLKDLPTDGFHLKDLPTAGYSGTTPNKTAPGGSSYSTSSHFFDQQSNQDVHTTVMNFGREMVHLGQDEMEPLRQDDLDVTLDVLKNIDRQYFQADDEMV